MDNQIVKAHLPCPDCGSSDALSLYSDGHTYCFSCQKSTHEQQVTTPKGVMLDTQQLTPAPLPKRGIAQSTCVKYQYYKSSYNGKACQVAQYYDEYGQLTGQKLRFQDKTFLTLGKVGAHFFGQHLYHGGDRLIITEGEIDCLTVSQLYGNTEAVVSIPCGAGSAKKVFEKNLKWLESFKEVIVVFDGDKAGEEGVKAIEGLLSMDKLKIVSLTSYKDPNDYFVNDHGNDLMELIDNARVYAPQGIINGKDLWEVLEQEPETAEGYSLPWDIPAQKMLHGIRKGEIIVTTAGTGTGKSTFTRELMYHLGMHHNLKVGAMFLEENNVRTAKGIIGIHVEKPLHISTKSITHDEYKKAFDETLGTGRFVFYDHFGSLDNNSVLSTIRYLAVVQKCDFVILDHLSIAVSGIEGNNERKLIDVLMTRLRSLAEELGVGILTVCHLKRVDNKSSAEEGGAISLDDLRGSQAIAQLSDTIIALERNQQDDSSISKNIVKVRVLKNRLTGETGLAGKLYYDKARNRLEVPSPELLEEDDKDSNGSPFIAQEF